MGAVRGPDDLERLSLLLVILGLGAVYTTSTLIDAKSIAITAIDEDVVGETVAVRGVIDEVSMAEDTVFFTITDSTGSIPAVAFQPDLAPAEGENHTVTGRVTLYQGELEIVAEKVVQGESFRSTPG